MRTKDLADHYSTRFKASEAEPIQPDESLAQDSPITLDERKEQ